MKWVAVQLVPYTGNSLLNGRLHRSAEADVLSRPNKPMVAAIIPLHERLGTGHGYSGVKPLTIAEIAMADEPIADLRSPQLAERLGPQALGDFHFDDLKDQNVFREVIAFAHRGVEGRKVGARQLARRLLAGHQSAFKGDRLEGFQELEPVLAGHTAGGVLSRQKHTGIQWRRFRQQRPSGQWCVCARVLAWFCACVVYSLVGRKAPRLAGY